MTALVTVWRSLPLLSKFAAAAVVLTVVLLVYRGLTVVWEIRNAPSAPSLGAAEVNGEVGVHAAALDRYRRMIDGRSFYVKPPRPVRRPTRPILPTVPDEPEERDPTPTRYGGPEIIALVGDAVWFDNDMRLAVGEQQGDLEVVAVRAPWHATLRWKGGEFVEPLFDRAESAIPLLEEDPQDLGESDSDEEADREPGAGEPATQAIGEE
jgi:hypothetical protein